MRNISRFPKEARKVADQLYNDLRSRPLVDFADWVLEFMRNGFTKKEAKAEFFRRKLSTGANGRIIFPAKKLWQRQEPPAPETMAQGVTESWKGLADGWNSKKSDTYVATTLAEMDARAERMKKTLEESRRGIRVTPPAPIEKPVIPEPKPVPKTVQPAPVLRKTEPKPTPKQPPATANSIEAKLRELEAHREYLKELNNKFNRK